MSKRKAVKIPEEVTRSTEIPAQIKDNGRQSCPGDYLRSEERN